MAQENKKEKEIEELQKFINTAEENLEAAKKALSKLTGEEFVSSNKKPLDLSKTRATEGGKIIEGVFDGENMIGPEGRVYPVPANYASKSKLVEGDRLKLTVAEDGSFIFKQIGPVQRKKLIGILNFEDNMYSVNAEGQNYNILYASVTYYKGKPNNKVTIVVPADGESTWAALDNIIHNVSEVSPGEDEIKDSIFNKPIQKLDPLTGMPIEEELKEEIKMPPEEPTQTPAPAPVEPRTPIFVQPKTQESVQTSAINTQPYVSELSEEAEQETTRTSLPDESFLPRAQDDEANSLGEVPPQDVEQPSDTPELEI